MHHAAHPPVRPPPSTQIALGPCTDGGSQRKLLASTAQASFTINLSDDLTADELSEFRVWALLA